MIFSFPNILTMLRFLAAPMVGFMLAQASFPLLGAFLFAVTALTDLADGWLARRWSQQSRFGAMLDPIADKAMVSCAFFGLAAQGMSQSRWFLLPALVILLREILISGLREFLGNIKLKVTLLAKWKTTLQLTAIEGMILSTQENMRWLAIPSIVLLWCAAILTLISGMQYLINALPYFRIPVDHENS